MPRTSQFTVKEWEAIQSVFNERANDFQLPKQQKGSVVLGTFNIRKLGAVDKRPPQSWDFLKKILERFDLIAIQEIMRDLSGFEHLHRLLGSDKYGMVVSDVAGERPGRKGNPERLGFLFNRKTVRRTAMASDIGIDRSGIVNNLYDNRREFREVWEKHTRKLGAWEEKNEQRRLEGKRALSKPPITLSRFLDFIRSPHYVSFEILSEDGNDPMQFLVANAHILFGEDKREREWEFKALLEWLILEAKRPDTLYHSNILLLGDCNLDFDNELTIIREDVDDFLRGINEKFLRSRRSATANFPLLTAHPDHGFLRTALRLKQTYDQIGFFCGDPDDCRLPTPGDNKTAGSEPDGFDYGVFNITELLSEALFNEPFAHLTKAQRKKIFSRAQWEISDHMPAWVRLPRC